MATKGLKDLLRRAYKAKDEGELADIEKEGEGENGTEMDSGMHIHVHPGERRDERVEPPHLDARRRDARRRDDDDPEGGNDVDKLCDRMEALETDMEEMKAQHEEMLSELSEDARHRLHDRRDRRRDARRPDARRRDESEEEEKRKREAEDARRRDAAAEEQEKKAKEAEDARHRDEEGNKKIEGELEMEAPPGTGDKARKARDSAYLEDSFQATVAMAEILVPGQKYPTFDRAATPKNTFDTICNLRRTTLDAAYKAPELHAVMEDAVGGDFEHRVKTMDCGQVRTLFRSVAAFQRQRNNAGNGYRAADDGIRSGAGGGMGPLGAAKNPAELNKRNAEFWANQRA